LSPGAEIFARASNLIGVKKIMGSPWLAPVAIFGLIVMVVAQQF
jgi:hypothetical protein